MNGCISTNLEVVPLDCTQLTVYSDLRLRVRGQDEKDSRVGKRFGSGLPALILTLNSVGCAHIYLRSSCDSRLMYARVMECTGFYYWCSF